MDPCPKLQLCGRSEGELQAAGPGEALLRAAVERCRGRRVQRVILHVDPARAAAVALYRKAGFQVDATIEGFYAPQRDAYRKFMDLQ